MPRTYKPVERRCEFNYDRHSYTAHGSTWGAVALTHCRRCKLKNPRPKKAAISWAAHKYAGGHDY